VRRSLRDLFRRWAEFAEPLHSNAAHAAAEFTCCAVPAEFHLFNMPVPAGVDDPCRRVVFSPRIEVNTDGLWPHGEAAE